MSITEAQHLQEELKAEEDLSAYVGQWVILRDGHVVASDLEPSRLLPDRREGDVLTLITDNPQGVFLL